MENIISLKMVGQWLSLSPVVADIFMSNLEERALDQFTDPASAWYQFVDDIFSVVKGEVVGQFFVHMNGQHQNIVFTVEEDIDGKLPFLDVMVLRQEEE